jgi:hypothetical protein
MAFMTRLPDAVESGGGWRGRTATGTCRLSPSAYTPAGIVNQCRRTASDERSLWAAESGENAGEFAVPDPPATTLAKIARGPAACARTAQAGPERISPSSARTTVA